MFLFSVSSVLSIVVPQCGTKLEALAKEDGSWIYTFLRPLRGLRFNPICMCMGNCRESERKCQLNQVNMDLNDLISKITAFRDARDWKQFHKANHLAAAIAIEAAELQEHFLWKTAGEVEKKIAEPAQQQAIAEELADVLIFSLLLAHELKVDPVEIILRKLKINTKKYPVEKARGSAAKYTEL